MRPVNTLFPPSTGNPDLPALSQRLDIPRPLIDFDETFVDVPIQSDKFILPVINPDNPLPEVLPCTLARALQMKIDLQGHRIVLLDCRYSGEYDFGQIKGAHNLTTYGKMLFYFNRGENNKLIFIMYCEMSSERGPMWMSLFRSYDREPARNQHPNLTNPELYLLKGGYRDFYQQYPLLCNGGYLPMLNLERKIAIQCQGLYESEIKKAATNTPKTPQQPRQHDNKLCLRQLNMVFSQPQTLPEIPVI